MPQQLHDEACSKVLRELPDSKEIQSFLCPERRISFDGFVNYEGRCFGVPYSYPGRTARIMRSDDTICIYSTDLYALLATYDVTWSRRDSFCKGQYEASRENCPPLR